MEKGTYDDFLDALLAFESGWDRDRYDAGIIVDWQLDQWAGGPVSDHFPGYSSWSQLSDAEWESMAYRSMNSLGFVGYQFGEALLIDLGYYQDDVFYGNGAASNTWDGTWTGKNGVASLEDFMTKEAQDQAIQEAFGYNTKVIVEGLANAGMSLDDILGTQATYVDNGQTVTVTMSMTGILAAAHLRGAWGTLNLLINGSVSTDEYGTSILRYIDQFGGYESPSVAEIIAVWDDSFQVPDGDDGDTGGTGTGDTGTGDTGTGDTGTGGTGTGGTGTGGTGTAGVTIDTADVVITWAWGTNAVITGFNPATDTIFINWIAADDLLVEEVNGGTVFSILSNNQSTTLQGIALADLSPSNFTILDSTAEAEVMGLIGDGSNTRDGDGSDGDGDGGHGDHDDDGGGMGQMISISLTSVSQVISDFDPARDMVHVEAGVTGPRFEIFEESGDALGLTVRLVVTDIDGTVLSTTILQGVGLDDLSLANFSVAEQSAFNEVTAALGQVIDTPDTGGYTLSYDSDGSNPPEVTGTTEAGGVSYRADTNADDITGFNPAIDQLDFGGTSVHGMIITKAPTGEIVIDSPWSDAAQIVQGVTYDQVTIDTFGVVGNEHFRQDIGGVVSWELGIGPRETNTVYVRSHEYGVHEVVDGFDPTTDKISFLYFGTRERLSVEDSADGLVISSLPSGQSVTLTGVTKAELIPGRVEFHHDQVMEDNLEVPFGFDQNAVTLVDRTVLLTPEAPAGQGTDGFQTRDMTGSDSGDGGSGDTGSGDTGSGDTGSGDTGGGSDTGDGLILSDGSDSVSITWNWGAIEQITGFDATEDVLDFGNLSADGVALSEEGDDLVIEVLGNGGHLYRFHDVQAEDLTAANLTAATWNTILEAQNGIYDQLTELGADGFL